MELECFGNNAGEKLREWYRSSVYKTQLNGIHPVHVTKCDVRVCHIIRLIYCAPHVLYVSVGVVHKKMPYDAYGVQVFITNNSSAYTSA